MVQVPLPTGRRAQALRINNKPVMVPAIAYKRPLVTQSFIVGTFRLRYQSPEPMVLRATLRDLSVGRERDTPRWPIYQNLSACNVPRRMAATGCPATRRLFHMSDISA